MFFIQTSNHPRYHSKFKAGGSHVCLYSDGSQEPEKKSQLLFECITLSVFFISLS